MPLMNEHSLRLLDFFRIRERVADYCLSEEGRQLLLASLPVTDAKVLAPLKIDVGALCDHLRENELPSLSFPSVERGLKSLSIDGMVLESEDLFAIGVWAKNFDILLAHLSKTGFQRFGKNGAEKEGLVYPTGENAAISLDRGFLADIWAEFGVHDLLECAPKLQHVSKIIFEIFGPDGELRDLPGIRKAKDAMAKANRELLSLADSYRNDPELKTALQSEEPTQRDGRTVLAVRANSRGRIKGIVHEVSASGQTVFVEPAALVEKNNELVQLEARLRAEIFRVLKEASEKLRTFFVPLVAAQRVLALLDARIARALQCHREGLVLAGDCERGFTMWKARHPLLGKRAVPIDVDLPDSTRTLIITGPNTGGKTVTLKTIGLFALMNQFGLALPAAQGTKFSIFDAVLADIGDEQSIDQSLSTFSGHMKVIADVAQNATSESLVLLDELGAGTDPEEGCAIAMGLLDYFIDKDSLTIATTHHGILKNYGYTKPGCLNASMEFDSAQLAPTYRIVMGVPGESRALEIATQTGLLPEIVQMARRYLAEERTDIGELIHSLNEKHRELERIEREQRKRLKEAVEDQRKADLAALRVRQREVELRRSGLSELKRLLSESRKTLENLVRELRESGVDTDKTKEVKKFLADLSKDVEQQYEYLDREEKGVLSLNAPAETEKNDDSIPAASAGVHGRIVEGAPVLFGPYRKKARAIRKAEGARWIIETGSIKLTADESDLLLLDDKVEEKPAYDIELAPISAENSARAAFELDLRGYRLGEALKAVEKQIDAASLQGLTLFSIIHGTGEGVLGKGIQEFLRSNPAVQDYHFARPEEGGYGKTIVRLKA